MVKKTKAWSVSASGGGRYPGANPVFFKDRQRVALVTALAIKVYLLSTRQMIAKIPVDCTDVRQLYLSQDEQDFWLVRNSGALDHVGVRENDVKRFVVPKSVKVQRIVSDSVAIASRDNVLDLGHISMGQEDGETLEYKTMCSFEADLFAVSPSRSHVAFASSRENSSITVVDAKNGNTTTQHRRDRRSATIAVSNSGIVAVGAPSGVIDMYYESGVRALKWHLEQVGALQFTLNDEYLLSGGQERVLVLWQLATEKQQFLPRLDGPITSLSCNHNSTLYGVTLGTQLIVLSAVDLISRLHVAGVRAYSKLSPGANKKKRKVTTSAGDPTMQLSLHPGTRHAYMFVGGSQVQVWNTARDEQESIIALAPALQTGKVRREHRIVDTNATHLEFTSDGAWMITVDVAASPLVDSLLSKYDVETALKFWRRASNGGWELVTRIVQPHGSTSILALRPHPSRAEVVTAGADGELRRWKLDEARQQWTLRRVLAGFATKTKAVAIAWSEDASVLALGLETGIHIVDAVKFKEVRTVSGIAGSRIRALEFVGKYLVVLAKTRLAIYDIVATQLMWSISMGEAAPLHAGRLIAADPEHGQFAIALNHTVPGGRLQARLALFDVTSPIPRELTVLTSAGVGALRLVPGTSSFAVLDTRGVVSSLAGTSSVTSNTAEPTAFRAALGSLWASSTPVKKTEEPTEEATKRNLDLNAFNNVFDESVSLDVLFDRVLNLVSSA